MKKIFFVFVFVLLICVGISFKYSKNSGISNKKVGKQNNLFKVVDNKKELYVSSIPVIDQEYTLNINKVDSKEMISDIPLVEVSEDIASDETIVQNNSENINDEISDITLVEVIEETENNDIEYENKLPTTPIVVEDCIESEDSSDLVVDYIETTSMGEVSRNIVNEDNKAIEIHYLKNGFIEEDGNTYYYENDVKVTGLKEINGVKNYFSPSGKYLGISKVKVIDVSYYQKDINWDLFANYSDCYGVILRLGYWTTLDKKFERNLNELKRLNIPYGIYLFSYATTINGARSEAAFTNNMIDKYDINPTLGIYYDLESWKTSSTSSDNITKNGYNYIAKGYIESVKNHVNNNYTVGIYSGRWYAMNRLGNIAKSYVLWVAEYNSTLKYDSYYTMWQYTSKGNVPGIDGNVDISYLY